MERYSRQLKILNQNTLEQSSVLIAGAGGLGGFSALYLALAGIGKIILVDDDIVEESNLNRQVLYQEEDIGKKKVFVAAERLREKNPNVEIIPVEKSIDTHFDIGQRIDIVVDGLDNIESRFVMEEFAIQKGIPYVFGAVEGFMGMVTFIDSSTKKLEDFIRRIPQKTPQVLGATAGMIAAIQSMEAIKYLTGRGDLLRNRLLIYDGLSTNFLEVKL